MSVSEQRELLLSDSLREDVEDGGKTKQNKKKLFSLDANQGRAKRGKADKTCETGPLRPSRWRSYGIPNNVNKNVQ